jgi:hypothetical protein
VTAGADLKWFPEPGTPDGDLLTYTATRLLGELGDLAGENCVVGTLVDDLWPDALDKAEQRDELEDRIDEIGGAVWARLGQLLTGEVEERWKR